MEIQKFEAYKYKGPTLKNANRRDFIEAFADIFTGRKICDYEIGGTTCYLQDEILWLHVDKEENGKYTDSVIIKLDLSDVGIEIGNATWDDDEEEFNEFIPEINLDTDATKQMKNYKQGIGKYNV
jgi:hypothetical protein